MVKFKLWRIDNSDWNKNRDYAPSKLECQTGEINMISENILFRNPENIIVLITMAGKRVDVNVSLTNNYFVKNNLKTIHFRRKWFC